MISTILKLFHALNIVEVSTTALRDREAKGKKTRGKLIKTERYIRFVKFIKHLAAGQMIINPEYN